MTGRRASPQTRGGNPLALLGVSLLVFPKLALGLSGFETGVAIMPLVKGRPGDGERSPVGRIKNTHRLLATAALVMSVYLITSSLVTTLLIPAREFADATASAPAGKANGRALAYLAHRFFGEGFGTVYDFSTILILWFAGASAMAGLLNIVPRYLPRYGMAPEWTRAARPLVLVFTGIAFLVTIVFKADVNAQGGAYATGVLVLMTSAAVAVTISARKRGARRSMAFYGLIAVVFAYTTLANVVERPDGIRIASLFIGIIVCSRSSHASGEPWSFGSIGSSSTCSPSPSSATRWTEASTGSASCRTGLRPWTRRSTSVRTARRARSTVFNPRSASSSWRSPSRTLRTSPAWCGSRASRWATTRCSASPAPRSRTRSPRSRCASAT